MAAIVLVEDEADLSAIVVDYLVAAGHQPRCFADGAQALAQVRVAPPELIVLDLMLPGLDGHFMMFVPSGRPISPVTHTDWEGVGVVPDVPTSAAKASDTAQLLALRAIVAREQDPDWKRRVQHRVDDLE